MLYANIKIYLYDMKSLIKRLLRENLLDEGSIEIPKDVVNKFGVLFDLIKNDYDNLLKKSGDDYNNPYIAFKDYFKLTDKANKPLNISVGFYNDKGDVGAGRMDTRKDILLINIPYFNGDYFKDFNDLIYHELVHAMDPLVRDVNLFGKYYAKKGAEPGGSNFVLSKSVGAKSEYEQNYEKYRKSQHEYIAELSPLINTVKKLTRGDSMRIKWIMWILVNIKNYDTAEDLYYATIGYMDDYKDNKLFLDNDSYWGFISSAFGVVKPWASKPTLYKKYINDLDKGITK